MSRLCKNCRYSYQDDRSPLMCNSNLIRVFYYHANRTQFKGQKYADCHVIPWCEEMNEANDCPCYKRKWWKFWVRNDK